MNYSPSLPSLKIFWVISVLERLVGLGILKNSVYGLTPDSIDLFLDLDEHVNDLFLDDDDIVEYTLKVLDQDIHDLSKDEKYSISEYVIQYKNNRTELFKTMMANK